MNLSQRLVRLRRMGAVLSMADRNQNPDGDIGSDLVREDASFAELVTQFVAGLSERVTRMEEAIRTADFNALQVAAHQLKGSGGGYGYPILTERAAQLERHARNQALDQCVEAIEELKDICERVVVDSAE
ncbi:MAG: Hpt domain-containing protein [Planctomycetota bacterium]